MVLGQHLINYRRQGNVLTGVRPGGGGGWLTGMHHRSHNQPPGSLHTGIYLQGGQHPGRFVSGGSASWGHASGGSASGGVGRPPPPTHTQELEKQAVRILLECFLLCSKFSIAQLSVKLTN